MFPIMFCRVCSLFCTVTFVLPSLLLFTNTSTFTSPQDNPKIQINFHVKTKLEVFYEAGEYQYHINMTVANIFVH